MSFQYSSYLFSIYKIQSPHQRSVWPIGHARSTEMRLEKIEIYLLLFEHSPFHFIVQEAVTKTIPKKKKRKKTKRLSEEDLQIAERRRETKGKRERESYNQLNAEFHRRVRRDKRIFLNEQCIEIEQNNRMRKTKDLFKKIRTIKGIFHARMGK